MILGTVFSVFSKLVWLVLFQMHWRGAKLLHALWMLHVRFVRVLTTRSPMPILATGPFPFVCVLSMAAHTLQSSVEWLEQRMYGPAFCVLLWGDRGLPQEEPHEKNRRGTGGRGQDGWNAPVTALWRLLLGRQSRVEWTVQAWLVWIYFSGLRATESVPDCLLPGPGMIKMEVCCFLGSAGQIGEVWLWLSDRGGVS